MPIQTGTHSEEIINHYQCKACQKWWSIGAPPEPPKEQYCPWCGEKQGFGEEKD